ncbi:MAG: hypothetical protein FD153_1045 [Rhodospirillaceae bacterium]|nr:MAG: hypothetical protein FD153_1045 [Rhodospirillaceae bacterium]
MNLRNMIMKILRDSGAQRMEGFNTIPQATPTCVRSTLISDHLRDGTEPD